MIAVKVYENGYGEPTVETVEDAATGNRERHKQTFMYMSVALAYAAAWLNQIKEDERRGE